MEHLQMSCAHIAVVCLVVICLQPLSANQLAHLDSPPKIIDGPKESPRYKEWNKPEGDRVKIYIQDKATKVEMACLASDVKPKVTYEWTKNGKPLDLSDPALISPVTNTSRYVIKGGLGTLIIHNATGYDVGEFQCGARNEHGKSLSKIAQIILAVHQTFAKMEDIERTPFLSSSLRLICHPPQNMTPPPSIWWTASEKELNVYQESERVIMDYNGDLNFANVIESDDISSKYRSYTCVAKNMFLRSFSQGHNIAIRPKAAQTIFPTEIMWNSERKVLGLKGEDVKFMCIFSGNPTPTIKWRRLGNIEWNKRHKIQKYNHELFISDVQFADQGTYICEGTNQHTNKPVSVRFSLTVEAKPQWVQKPDDVQVSVEGSASFQCKASGIPKPQVQWFINGIPINNTSNSRRTLNGDQLTFRDLTKEDSQVIQCNATNKHGSLFADFSLRVLAMKPAISTSFGKIKVAKDSSVTLTCPNVGYPKPKMTWYKGGQKLQGDRYIITEDSITILNVTERNNGTYFCKAVNLLGSDEKLGDLIVRAKTTIITAPRDKEANESVPRVSFRCSATTDTEEFPNLKFKWMKDGVVLKPGKKYIIVKGKLMVRDISRTDSGSYTCVAYNGLDNDTKTATLKVKAAPDPPTDVKVTRCNKAVSLKWTAGSENFSPIKSYVIEYKTSFKPNEWNTLIETGMRKTTILDIPLSAWVNYTFRVSAQNGIGRSGPSQSPNATCSTPPTIPDRHPKNIQFRENEEGKLIINWEQMDQKEHNGPGFQYVVVVKKDKSPHRKTYVREWTDTELVVVTNDTYQKYQVYIIAKNDVGNCTDKLSYYTGYSGMGKPTVSPGNFSLDPDMPFEYNNATFMWDGVDTSVAAMKGKFEGYKIRYWRADLPEKEKLILIKPSHLRNRRKRRAVQEKLRATVTNLPPYSDLYLDMVAVNTFFESAPSNEINITTPEGIPDEVYQLQINRRGVTHVALSWYPPRRPNGEVTEYQVAYTPVYGVDVGPRSKKVIIPVESKKSNELVIYRIDGLEANHQYTIYVWAATRVGTGPHKRLDFETAQYSTPIAPKILDYETGLDSINISWSIPYHNVKPSGLVHYARYRKLGSSDYQDVKPGRKTENWQIIPDLESGITYEVQVVAFNGEGFISTSGTKTITTDGSRDFVATGGVLKATWFIIIMVCLAIVILALIIICLVKRSRGNKYYVQEREKLRGIDQDEKKAAHFNEFNDNGEKQPLAGSPDYDPDKVGPDSERDSLEEYGDVDPSKFNEDGSFIGQYGPDKSTASEVAPPTSAMTKFV